MSFDAHSKLQLGPCRRSPPPSPWSRLAGRFRSDAPVDLKGSGSFSYAKGGMWNGAFHAETDRFGYAWLFGDRVRADVFVKDRLLTVTNLTAEVYGGEFSGQGDLDLGKGQTIPYTMTLNWKKVDVAELVKQFKQIENDPYKGLFTGILTLSGRVDDRGQHHDVKGEGRMHLREGYLFKVPLFGGLSRYVGWVYPGLAFSSQSDFDASLRIEDRKIFSDDIELEGNLMSLNAEGVYGFDHSLDYRVQVKPLGANLLAEALRVLTMPVSALLKFKLSGTLTEPVWEPDNWPSDLMDKFRGGE